MTIKITIAEAQRILTDKLGATLLNGTGLDACVTVEIATPPQPPNPLLNKIRAIRALRDDYTARNEHLGLAEAKRQVELVYDNSSYDIV